jgi:broad specificity phosphatase PhoE
VADHKIMKPLLLVCGLLAVSNPAALYAEPPQDGISGALSNAVILIIRHGEKPDKGSGLTAVGQARANALAGYFKNYTLDGQPLKLDCLFAAADSKVSDRPRLTLEPTSKLLGLPINTPFGDMQYKELADEIRSKPHGQHILICWHHGEIPGLVQALGADADRLIPKAKWPDDIFNWVIELRYDFRGRLVAASRINQPF